MNKLLQVTYLVWTNLGHDRERLVFGIKTTLVLIRLELGERYALIAQQVGMHVLIDALVELSFTFARRLVSRMHVLARLLVHVHSADRSLASIHTSLSHEILGRLGDLLGLLLFLSVISLLILFLGRGLFLAHHFAKPGGMPHLSTLLSYDGLEQLLLHS